MKNILIIEPDEITRLLLAKEVEETENIPITVQNIKRGFEIVQKNTISLVICDNDHCEAIIFTEELRKSGFDVPIITTSTFLNNQELTEDDGFSLEKPIGIEGYTKLRGHIKNLKKIA